MSLAELTLTHMLLSKVWDDFLMVGELPVMELMVDCWFVEVWDKVWYCWEVVVEWENGYW